ncbi:MAG: VPLPA-CTERM-specific exosortase XrtD [Gammaproteobacteria bacterium]|nr:VPLPA-CTERM-specific exosortase XrtD [Gammaproteobacteria bacterium]
MENNNSVLWKESSVFWAVIIVALLMLVFTAYDGLSSMVRIWETREEYSHGYLIPFITLFLIWQKYDDLCKQPFIGSWYGVVALFISVVVIVLGIFGAVSTIIQYGFLLAILSIALSMMGWLSFKKIFVPLIILSFMIPLPGFILQGLSSQLQLISSQIGVAVIRLFDISVYLEGNVIDLGNYKLQVVEACSGLNYLFPLMSLSFMAAYFYQAELWKRSIIFISSIPVTILMNSFRIGVIGVLVEHWGQSQAEGFLHDFEGWVIFMACMVILVVEMWALNKIGSNNRPLKEVFGLEFPEPQDKNASFVYRTLPKQFIAALGILSLSSISIIALNKNEIIIAPRAQFAEFPMEIDGWKGKQASLEQIYLDSLKLDDYILSDFVNDDNKVVNFYVAYYESQEAGEAAHSPRTCIPGGGWQIKSLDAKKLEDIKDGNNSLIVNRLLIQKGDYTQVVYYWFKLRERNITSEYMVKLYLMWDAITKNRSDLALVRFTSLAKPGEDIGEVDERMQSLVKVVYPKLDKYIPE